MRSLLLNLKLSFNHQSWTNTPDKRNDPEDTEPDGLSLARNWESPKWGFGEVNVVAREAASCKTSMLPIPVTIGSFFSPGVRITRTQLQMRGPSLSWTQSGDLCHQLVTWTGTNHDPFLEFSFHTYTLRMMVWERFPLPMVPRLMSTKKPYEIHQGCDERQGHLNTPPGPAP